MLAKSRPKSWLFILGVVAACLLAGAVWFMVSRPTTVAVLEIKPATTEIGLSVVGRVRPADLVQVTSLNAGQVIQLLADNGDRVEAGAALAVVRSTVEQAQTQANAARERAVRAEAVEARQSYDRTRTLADKGFAAPAALDIARAKLNAAEANLAAAIADVKAAAERTREFTIRAPMDGTVLLRPIDNGQVVAAGETLFEVGSDAGTEIWAEVDETYADDLQPGMPARAALSGSETMFGARLSEVSPRVDASTGGRQVRLVPDTTAVLPPGRSVDVTVVLSQRPNAIVIPRKAVMDATAGPKVYVVDNEGVVRVREVAILRWPSVNAIVEKGLKAGDRIVLDPSLVRNEQRVRPVPAGGQ
ncbi:hemolysin secretion protein D [Asticcacaulis sp. AC402]|nr:hemolysin secretion protein D [Asticcacaulis sp. AC402]